MKRIKRLVSCLLALALLLTLLPQFPLRASAGVLVGDCGSNLHWTLDTDTRVLTITGSGRMWDYTVSSSAGLPEWWRNDRTRPTSVVLPDGLTYIGKYAFYFCELTGVNIPASVTEIGNAAFSCNDLVRVTIPEGVTVIGDEAFASCNELEKVTLPDSLTRIGAHAFEACRPLTGVTIPRGVTRIGEGAFGLCTDVNRFTVAPENTAYCSVDGVLFSRDKHVLVHYPPGRKGAYEIPNGTTELADGAFYGCERLNGVTIPNSVTRIGSSAFFYCDGLKSVLIPGSVKTVGSYAFSLCENLTDVTALNGVTEIGEWAFMNNDRLANVTLPDSVTSIGEAAFHSCWVLKSFTFPSGLREIGGKVLSDCRELNSVWIPQSVTSIRAFAFSYCEGLRDVWYGGSEEQWAAVPIGSGNSSLTKATIHYDAPFPTPAPTPEPFYEAIYRADRLAQDTEEAAAYRAFSHTRTPCEIMEAELHDSGFGGWMAAWDSFTTCVDSVAELPAVMDKQKYGQKDLYSAMLLTAVGVYSEDGLIEALGEAANDAKELCKTAQEIKELAPYFQKSYWNNADNLPLVIKDEIKSLIVVNYQLPDLYRPPQVPKTDYLGLFTEGFEVLDVFFKGAETFTDFFQQVAAYVRLRELSESMKTAVTQLRDCAVERGARWELQAALNDCVEIITSSTEAFENELLVKKAYQASGRFAYKEYAGLLWDKLVSTASDACPPLKLFLVAYKSGRLVSNLLFSTDELSESAVKVHAALDLEELAAQATESLWQSYAAAPTEDAAAALLDSIRVRFGLYTVDCDAADKFCKTVDDAAWSRIRQLFSKEDASYTDVHLTIERLKTQRQDDRNTIETAWIDGLKTDWPELYDVYAARLNGSPEPLPVKVREYSICCPVDVFVYDAEDRLVASVSDGRVFADGKLSAVRLGEEKLLRFYDGAEYRVDCRGYGDGEMDVRVEEYGETGGLQRAAGLYELPVSSGTVYSTVTKADPGESASYTVTNGEQTLPADYDTLAGGAQTCAVTVKGGLLRWLGEAATTAEVCADAAVGLLAAVPAGCAFAGWETDGEGVAFADASAAETTARIGGDCTITARFVEQPEPDRCPGDFDASYYAEQTVPPSCTERGYTAHTCTLCGKCFKDSFTEATGHSFGEASWVREPTCTEDGLARSVCAVCGAVDEYTVKAPGHAYQNGVCLVCGRRLELGFTDVKTSAYYYPAVLWAVERGVTTGTSADTFSPGTDCTRGQVVTFLWRAAGEPSPADGDAMPFGDVKKSAYYYRAVLWAVENGVTSGTAPGQFSPNDTCTRGQVVTFLWRANGSSAPQNASNPFTDVGEKEFFFRAVLWAVENGITVGTSSTEFSPKQGCTRGQVVTFLYRDRNREIDLRE